MKTITITPRIALEAIHMVGLDTETGLEIESMKPPPDEFLDKPVEVVIPETIEEFDRWAQTR